MRHQAMALGVIKIQVAGVNKVLMAKRSLKLYGPEDKKYFSGLWTLPGVVLPNREFELTLEALADEFSSQFSVVFDLSKGEWGRAIHSQINETMWHFLPLKGTLSGDRLYLGLEYDDYVWIEINRLKNHSSALGMGLLEPVVLEAISQFK